MKWVSRKYLFTVAAFVVGSIGLFLHLLTGTDYVALVGTLHLGYQLSNAYDSRTDMLGRRNL